MTNGLRMDSTRQRALFQTFSGGLSSKTKHISSTNKRKSTPDETNNAATEAPLCKVLVVSPDPNIDPDLKKIQQNGLEGSLKNSKAATRTHEIQVIDTIAANIKNHEDSDGEDLYELLEIDYNDDCPSDDSDVMLIEDTQKAIIIEDDDVDGGQSNCVSSREGKNTSSSSSTNSCDGGENIEQNTIVIEDEEDSRLSSNDRNGDKEEDSNSNISSVIEYERWMTFRSTDDNDDEQSSGPERNDGVAYTDANDRISVDRSENNDVKEDNRLSNSEHNSRGSDADSNFNSCSVIKHEGNAIQCDNSKVHISNEVNTDAHHRTSNNQIENNLNSIEGEDEEVKVSKSSKINGPSSIGNADDKIIVIDDDDDDEDEEVTGKTDLPDETCSYTLVDVIDTVDTEISKPTKRESVVSFEKIGLFV